MFYKAKFPFLLQCTQNVDLKMQSVTSLSLDLPTAFSLVEKLWYFGTEYLPEREQKVVFQ